MKWEHDEVTNHTSEELAGLLSPLAQEEVAAYDPQVQEDEVVAPVVEVAMVVVGGVSNDADAAAVVDESFDEFIDATTDIVDDIVGVNTTTDGDVIFEDAIEKEVEDVNDTTNNVDDTIDNKENKPIESMVVVENDDDEENYIPNMDDITKRVSLEFPSQPTPRRKRKLKEVKDKKKDKKKKDKKKNKEDKKDRDKKLSSSSKKNKGRSSGPLYPVGTIVRKVRQ